MNLLQSLTLIALSLVGGLFETSKCEPVNDVFNEELMLKPLPSGHVYANFQFTTVWQTDIEQQTCE